MIYLGAFGVGLGCGVAVYAITQAVGLSDTLTLAGGALAAVGSTIYVLNR